MGTESLEEKISRTGDPVAMLRDSPSRRVGFDYPRVYSSWQEEQRSWTTTAALFDQSHHMTDVYFRGPDVKRLLSDTGTNSFATFGRDRAKHFVTCNASGQVIGTAVLFGLEDDEVDLVGPAGAANWLQYQAEIGGYDVEVTRDERTAVNPAGRLTFRYEIEGPNAWDVIEKAHGGPVDRIRFFTMTDLTLGGVPVRALSHTMSGVPGAESMGLEIFGPAENGPACWDALLAAGEEFGLVRAGALAYYTGGTESGYPGQPLPAVYTGEDMKPYREWLRADGYEGSLSLGGSFRSESIEDYYVTPYDFGYGHLVKFDHDFIGRDALERAADGPHRNKVWLRWDRDDVVRVYGSSLYGGDERAKFLDTPFPRYARIPADSVLIGDDLVGISTQAAYTVNAGDWFSIAFVDEAHARDGAEVTVLWGEGSGGTVKPGVESHSQTAVRATVSTRPLAS